MKPCLGLALLLVLFFLVGCGGDRPAKTFNNAAQNLATPKDNGGVAVAGVAREPDTEFVALVQEEGKEAKAKAPARKIKHTSELKLITDDFDKVRDELQRLIGKHDGYEATADVQSAPGSPRRGTWKVRVPIEQFAAFREAARKLAEVESDAVNTED